jgi:hypothetical protein
MKRFTEEQIKYIEDRVINRLTFPLYIIEKGLKDRHIKTDDLLLMKEQLEKIVIWIRSHRE